MPLPAFDAVAGKFASSQNAPKSSLEMFTLLCEEIVDRVADILEQLAGELAAERRMVVVRRYSNCALGRQMPGRREHEALTTDAWKAKRSRSAVGSALRRTNERETASLR